MQYTHQTLRTSLFRVSLMAALFMICVNVRAYAADFKLEFPLACIHGQNCWILNYMDANHQRGEAQDFTCGPRTTDGRDGIDIAVRDLAAANSGVAVLAAADGTVTDVMDGMDDRLYSQSEAEQLLHFTCGNTVVIDHGKGWQTRYCHLRSGSTQVRPGDVVQAGHILGAVGMSGLASWPMLNFAVARHGTARDPYTNRTALEGCGLSGQSLWKYPEDVPYRAFAIYNLGFSALPPQEDILDRSLAPVQTMPDNAEYLTFWASVFDANKGDLVEMVVNDPRGVEIMNVRATLPDDRKKRLMTLSKPREAIWRNGAYTGTITITRGIGSAQQVSQWSAQILIGE